MGLAEASVRLIHGVRLIWGPLNTGFTLFVSIFSQQDSLCLKQVMLTSRQRR